MMDLKKMKTGVLEWLYSVKGDIVSFCVCFAVVTFILSVFLLITFVPTSSMYPTLNNPCITVASRTAYWFNAPKRGDIVVLRRDNGGKTLYTKRIIGEPGDTVTIVGGITYINGEQLEEEYLAEPADTSVHASFNVPEDCYFVMGDNRNHSYDSRDWEEHFVPRENIQAKIMEKLSFHVPVD